MRDFREGVADTRESVRNSPLQASEKGVSSAENEAQAAQAEDRRVGQPIASLPSDQCVTFSAHRLGV